MHGYLADKNSFAYQTPYFSRFFNVHAIDLKGFGENKGMDYPYGLSDYAREVREYIKENGLVKPCVIAHSFGGRIALRLMSDSPELFGKVVLTGSAGLKPKRGVKYRVKKTAFCIAKKFMDKERLLKFYSADYRALDPIMRQSFNKIVGEHLDYTLPFIKNKVLLVFGENDKDTPLYMAKRFNKGIKDSKLIVIKNAGHFCFIDCPLKFNTEVREFLLSE